MCKKRAPPAPASSFLDVLSWAPASNSAVHRSTIGAPELYSLAMGSHRYSMLHLGLPIDNKYGIPNDSLMLPESAPVHTDLDYHTGV